jgi:hypothetical protein
MLLTRRNESGFKEQQKPPHGNADGGKQNVEGDVGGKLQPGQQKRIKRVHFYLLWKGFAGMF